MNADVQTPTGRRHLHEDVDEIRIAAHEVPVLSPEERTALVGRIVGFVRDEVPEIPSLRDAADWLEQADVADAPLLQERLYELHALLTETVDEPPLGAGYDEPALEHEP